MKLGRKQLVILGALGIGGGILFLLIFVYNPLLSKAQRMGEELRMIQEETAAARDLDRRVKIDQEMSLLGRPDVASLMDAITKAGEFYTVNFISINPQEIEQPPDSEFLRLPLQLELEAEYQNFGKFLASLDKIKGSVIVVSRFSMKTDVQALPLLKIKLLLNLYLDSSDG